MLVQSTPPYLSTGISNLLQPGQAEVVLGQLSTFLVSLVGTLGMVGTSLYCTYSYNSNLTSDMMKHLFISLVQICFTQYTTYIFIGKITKCHGFLFLSNQRLIFRNFLLCLPSKRSAHSQVPSQVATHQEIGSQLWAGQMPDSNLGLQDDSLAHYH
jgi:hypothetical protein